MALLSLIHVSPNQADTNYRRLRLPVGRFERCIVTGIMAVRWLLALTGGIIIVFWLIAADTSGGYKFHWLRYGTTFVLLAYSLKFLFLPVDEDDD